MSDQIHELMFDFVGKLFLAGPAGADLPPSPGLSDAIATDMELEFRHSTGRWLETDPTLTALLTDDATVVNRDLADFYGIEHSFASEWEAVKLPTSDRAGMLTMGAFLRRLPSPPQRGVFLVQKLTCSAPPPAPPPGLHSVWSTPQQEPAKQTILENYGDAQPACNACHSVYTAYAIALDRYDEIGRYRTSIGKTAIDTSYSLYTLAPAPLSASEMNRIDFDNVHELAEGLSKSRDVRACIVQQLASRLRARALSADEMDCVLTQLEAKGDNLLSLIAILSPNFASL